MIRSYTLAAAAGLAIFTSVNAWPADPPSTETVTNTQATAGTALMRKTMTKKFGKPAGAVQSVVPRVTAPVQSWGRYSLATQIIIRFGAALCGSLTCLD
jgi:hypothetical protein